MSNIEVSNTALTAQARLESNISVEHDYTDVVVLSGASVSSPLDHILSEYLSGCGRVDLVKIEVKVLATATKQKFYFGFSSTSSNLTAKEAARKMSGKMFCSNDFTVGDEIVFSLIPEDTLSRQIRPNSADLPMINFLMEAPEEAEVGVHFFLKVRGIRQHFGGFQ